MSPKFGVLRIHGKITCILIFFQVLDKSKPLFLKVAKPETENKTYHQGSGMQHRKCSAQNLKFGNHTGNKPRAWPWRPAHGRFLLTSIDFGSGPQ